MHILKKTAFFIVLNSRQIISLLRKIYFQERFSVNAMMEWVYDEGEIKRSFDIVKVTVMVQLM